MTIAMTKWTFTQCAALAVAAASLGITASLLACGETQTEEMERGLTTDVEETMPVDPSEMKMTEEERRAQAAAQEEAKELRDFNDAEAQEQAPE